jgi:ribosomal protein S18 acetylase RimI-like enzyme
MTDASPLTVRPLRWEGRSPHPDDLAAVAGLYAAYEQPLLGSVDSTAADLGSYLELPDVDRARTALLERDGGPAGFVFVSAETYGKDVYADVAYIGGAPVAAACADHVLSSARESVAERGEPGWTLRISHWLQDDVLASALAARGLEQVRRFYRMRIASDSPDIPERMPDLPEGVEIVVRDDDSTRRTIWSLDMASFADHYNFTPTPYEAWWEHMSSGSTRDPDGWWLLTVDGEPAAFCLLDESRAEIGEGYVSVLGVKQEFRGRGLGSLLLRRSFVRYRDLGRVATSLGVDAENTTGAVGVYEAVGMTAVRTLQGWALPLPLAAQEG